MTKSIYKISNAGSDFEIHIYNSLTGDVIWKDDPHGDKETYWDILEKAQRIVEALNG